MSEQTDATEDRSDDEAVEPAPEDQSSTDEAQTSATTSSEEDD